MSLNGRNAEFSFRGTHLHVPRIRLIVEASFLEPNAMLGQEIWMFQPDFGYLSAFTGCSRESCKL